MTVRLNVLDEDDNTPTAQTNKHVLKVSELKEVSFVFLVDFLLLWFRINRKNIVAINTGGILKELIIASYLLQRSYIIKRSSEKKRA